MQSPCVADAAAPFVRHFQSLNELRSLCLTLRGFAAM
jgi:hypothetical protein